MRAIDRITKLERQAQRMPPRPEVMPRAERQARIRELIIARLRRSDDPPWHAAAMREGNVGPDKLDQLASRFVADLDEEAYKIFVKEVTQ